MEKLVYRLMVTFACGHYDIYLYPEPPTATANPLGAWEYCHMCRGNGWQRIVAYEDWTQEPAGKQHEC